MTGNWELAAVERSERALRGRLSLGGHARRRLIHSGPALPTGLGPRPARTVAVGSAAVTTGSLTPAASGTPVTSTYAGPGAGGADNVMTDSSGNFSDQFIFNASGSWAVTATFAGDATRQPQSASRPLTVLGL